jgi:hypothetical protein
MTSLAQVLFKFREPHYKNVNLSRNLYHKTDSFLREREIFNRADASKKTFNNFFL